MERQRLLEAIAGLDDDAFTHVAVVCHDIANRLPGPVYAPVGVAARACLGIPEPEPVGEPEPAPSASTVETVVIIAGESGIVNAGTLTPDASNGDDHG
jgi:hypothetical protein